MPRKRKISFAVSAVEDLEVIRTWYADQQIPEVGEQLLREIVAAVERHADFPQSGRIVPEFGIVHLREIIHAPFRVIYRLDKSKVRIVRVWRSERELKMP
ncbi:MAG: type II toxin-antitoxin system RelE/ParE family toxin [Desulfomonile sp.]|nr:type II toxin-antitoxin system RelE/ParE family toxin [Desulfomonile sp.]